MINHRNTVKSWFRYHHFTTHPALQSHSGFMTCLSHLEIKGNMILGDKDSENENWQDILSCINKLTDEEIDYLLNLIKRNKQRIWF